MPKRGIRVKEDPAMYYERRGVLGELENGAVEFILEEELRRQILAGRRTRRLQNIAIKLDPTVAARVGVSRKVCSRANRKGNTLSSLQP